MTSSSYRHIISPPADASITTQRGFVLRGFLSEIDVFHKKVVLTNAYVVGRLPDTSINGKQLPNPGPYASLTLDGEELLDILLHGMHPPAGHSPVQHGYAWSPRASRAPSASSSCRLSPFSGHSTPPPYYDPHNPPPMPFDLVGAPLNSAYSPVSPGQSTNRTSPPAYWSSVSVSPSGSWPQQSPGGSFAASTRQTVGSNVKMQQSQPRLNSPPLSHQKAKDKQVTTASIEPVKVAPAVY